MKTVICVPWRGGDANRERAWDLVRRYYQTTGLPIYTADSSREVFSAGLARNAAAYLAEPWDIVVFIDADCVLPLANLERGIKHAEETQHITLPWDTFFSMTKEGHDLGFDQSVPFMPGDNSRVRNWQVHSIPCETPLRSPGGNMVVPRAVWERTGGFDERFTGWNFEDAAILIEAGEFDRLAGPLYHFWHPSRAFTTPVPDFYWQEYRGRRVIQNLIDEGVRINRFGSWG